VEPIVEPIEEQIIVQIEDQIEEIKVEERDDFRRFSSVCYIDENILVIEPTQKIIELSKPEVE
jgi:phage-related protein